jgi:hypothetical protein
MPPLDVACVVRR